MQIHSWISMLSWLSELLALLRLRESLISTRIRKRETTPKICTYPTICDHAELTVARSTPIQRKIYAEDFDVIISHLPFLKSRLESDVSSKFLRKAINRVRTYPRHFSGWICAC